MLPFDEVGPGVFRRRYELLDQNIGVVLGEAAVLVIDTRSAPSHAAHLVAEVAVLTSLPIGWVINTHWHWDHVLGNSEFRAAEIWGHRRCRQVLAEDAGATIAAAKRYLDVSLHEELDQTRVVPPTAVMETDATIDIGGCQVNLRYRGRGHTDSDVSVSVGDVLFAGDLLEEGAPPAFGDSYPLQWPATVRAHLGGAPGVVVPGHGDLMDAAATANQIEELEEVARRCASAKSVSELDLSGAPYPDEVMKLALSRAIRERLDNG